MNTGISYTFFLSLIVGTLSFSCALWAVFTVFRKLNKKEPLMVLMNILLCLVAKITYLSVFLIQKDANTGFMLLIISAFCSYHVTWWISRKCFGVSSLQYSLGAGKFNLI